jgi:hypothetical protein
VSEDKKKGFGTGKQPQGTRQPRRGSDPLPVTSKEVSRGQWFVKRRTRGECVKTGLSVKKSDIFEIEAKGAYATKDGGKIGPEGGARCSRVAFTV